MGSLKDEMMGLQPGEKSDEASGRRLEGESQGSELPPEDDTLAGDGNTDPHEDQNEPTSKLQGTEAHNDEPVDDGDVSGDKMVQEEGGNEKSVVMVSQPADPPDPFSPAPFGQHHMRTQVSLEVVQCCSTATSPMTPPEGGHTFFFPNAASISTDTKDAALQAGQTVQFCSVATSPMTPKPTVFPEVKSKEQATAGKSDGCGPQTEIKQQRMSSMDQDITILVTHHGSDENEECDDAAEQVVESEACEEKISGEKEETLETSNESTEQSSVSKPAVPESPAPSGCHNIRTQVSLEVVQCQSAATSPMTPPEGDQAFRFPSSLISSGADTKDAELQVGPQVECRSVATAPMTPRTPTTTTFPETIKEVTVDEKILEVEEEKPEDEVELMTCNEKEEEKCEEPVQEVSWDEKGMTWEVYGAVVEVAVLGSAIQKHLEKQVKKQKGLPPPPPLNPSATPLVPEAGKGCLGFGKGRSGKRAARDGKGNRRRKNPFRVLMENMQQPHCCSRAHSTE
ncbi:G protein-regulated inducer of neurite outgrowth 1 [Synchiropus splendidus]|uniref:G protein-regulated inducer of neurite outgrowth 1 n=1 Tax=Synchiropus splendidus TaxID=270530 RepID=UPI00237EBC31|nr:G protein-regulated inducer of neurite outgrowth 1 [Synchiropus splendidus]